MHWCIYILTFKVWTMSEKCSNYRTGWRNWLIFQLYHRPPKPATDMSKNLFLTFYRAWIDRQVWGISFFNWVLFYVFLNRGIHMTKFSQNICVNFVKRLSKSLARKTTLYFEVCAIKKLTKVYYFWNFGASIYPPLSRMPENSIIWKFIKFFSEERKNSILQAL